MPYLTDRQGYKLYHQGFEKTGAANSSQTYAPSLRMMDQAVGRSGRAGGSEPRHRGLGSDGEIGHSPIRKKRSNHFPSTFMSCLERFEFREPYGSCGVQRFGEKRAFRRKNTPAIPIRSLELRSEIAVSFGFNCQPVPPENYLAAMRLAERVGFEPTVRFPAHTLSKRAP